MFTKAFRGSVEQGLMVWLLEPVCQLQIPVWLLCYSILLALLTLPYRVWALNEMTYIKHLEHFLHNNKHYISICEYYYFLLIQSEGNVMCHCYGCLWTPLINPSPKSSLDPQLILHLWRKLITIFCSSLSMCTRKTWLLCDFK